MQIDAYISVVQRRRLAVEARDAHLFPILEPLFRIETHMSFEERLQLFSLSLRLPQGFVICEVGSYVGASTAFMAAAASLKGGHVHAVDTWANTAMTLCEPVEDTFARFHENTHIYRHFITPHRGQAAGLKDEIPQVDMLFIDGDHSYEAVKADLIDYAPKVKPGGALVMHDFTQEAVNRALHDVFPPDALVDLGIVQSLQAFQLK